jgi:hypothetical protein
MSPNRITEANYAAALAMGQVKAETEFRARAARYLPERDVIEILTTQGSGFLIPRHWISALSDVPDDELAKLEIWPDGSAIELEHRDIQINVHGMLTELLPKMLPTQALAQAFARRGGQATSDAKRRSAIANGRRGGRPRKARASELVASPTDLRIKNEEDQDAVNLGPLTNPAFASFLEEHARLARLLTPFSPTQLIACVGGLLTMPDWQASTLRLEVLQHLIVACCQGTSIASAADLRSWLTELGNGKAGHLEDPSEDVFVSRVHTFSRDYLVFEGIYEASGFYLQRFLNILENMPPPEPYAAIRRSVHSLLALSNEVARRAGVSAFEVGETQPLRDVPSRVLRDLAAVSERVTFSRNDLNALDIKLDDLDPFVFDPRNRAVVRTQKLGQSTLERSPLVWIGDRLRVALPTAITMAVRRLMIDFCLSGDQSESLYSSYANEVAATFARMSLLGGCPAPAPEFHKIDGIYTANISSYVDRGRLLHFCFVVDCFDAYSETGMIGISPTNSAIAKAIDTSLEITHRNFAFNSDFREALTLVVICPWGRPITSEFSGIEDGRWRIESISAADLATISCEPRFSPLELWRLLDTRDALRRSNVELINFNGLLNLFAWSDSLKGHLIPHGQIPDDYDSESPLNVIIPQHGLLEIRRKAVRAGNVHLATTWDGRTVRVRREGIDSYFEEDRDVPLYVSLDDLDAGYLLAVFETSTRGWWVKVETPNSSDRDLQYRLWHVLSVWLARAVLPVVEVASDLPEGPIAWVCTFEDSEKTPASMPIPSNSDAASLLEVKSSGNVVHVIARFGFLASFRTATNEGEMLLIESFVVGTLRLARTVLTASALRTLMSQIVPSEWARDMHIFPAQRFRDFVRDRLPKNSILITRTDDAYSRIGLGWRGRNRSEGSRIHGIGACCSYLATVVHKTWEEMRDDLRKYNRLDLIMRLVANHERISADTDQWLRTARSLLSLHAKKEATTRAATYQIAKLNAGSLCSRLVIEMALCECPENGGVQAGDLDIGRLLANAMQLHHLGGWSEAIKYGGKKPEIRVTPLGDIHTHIDFEDKILNPYGQSLGGSRFRRGADIYESHFREPEVSATSKGAVDPEFWTAWTEAYGFTIDEMRIFMDNLEGEGIRRHEAMFQAGFGELSSLDEAGRLDPQTVQNLLTALTLMPRSSWASTPKGFASKDWYPWRFRRRLSAIARPILQLTECPDPIFLIAPGMVREGATKLLDYCFRGGFDAKDFPPGRMRAWIGAEENRRGHKFNSEVAERLKQLRWNVRANIRATEILNDKLDRDYGDVDVLAWRDGRVLAIECKNLELAMTAGEISRQLHDFLGEQGSQGKPDRLKRHLARIELLQRRAKDVAAFVGSIGMPTVEALLVFSGIVPMHFSELAAHQGAHFTTIDDLDSV